jgi:hypothetical protein
MRVYERSTGLYQELEEKRRSRTLPGNLHRSQVRFRPLIRSWYDSMKIHAILLEIGYYVAFRYVEVHD